jgi:predicted transposase YbfD/YdcC
MPCTVKKTLEVAAQANVGLIVQVKDNQPTLHQQIQAISQTTAPLGFDKSHDKGRNRDETRVATVFDAAGKVTDTEWGPHINTIIQVQRRVLTRSAATGLWNRSTETAFYVSNTMLGPTRAAETVRAHWGIENTSHYSRDVTFGEDRSRIRINPGVFARLRSFAFNILKANKTSTISQDRYRAALAGIDNLLKFIACSEH